MNAYDNQQNGEKIQQIELNSGSIKRYFYNKAKEILCITFKDGYVYQFFNVPENVIEAFGETEQPDTFYLHRIRKQYKRLFRTYNLDVLQ